MIGELTDLQIEEVLRENVLGRIGCNDGERIYVVPVNYVFDGKYIIGHATLGMKIEMMRKNPRVCFEVDDMITFTNWKSVIAWGEYQELVSPRERQAAMKLFTDRMMYIKISEAAAFRLISEKEINPHSDDAIKTIVYRIVITEKTGRFERH